MANPDCKNKFLLYKFVKNYVVSQNVSISLVTEDISR